MNMIAKIKIALVLLAGAFTSISSATIVSGTVKHIYVLAGDRVAFQLHEHDKDSLNAMGSNGSCIGTNSGTFIIDLSQPENGTNETGPAQYALLLSAQAQQKTILVRGSDSCLYVREVVNWLRINDN